MPRPADTDLVGQQLLEQPTGERRVTGFAGADGDVVPGIEEVVPGIGDLRVIGAADADLVGQQLLEQPTGERGVTGPDRKNSYLVASIEDVGMIGTRLI